MKGTRIRSLVTGVIGREHPNNRYYGHDAILKAYAGVKLPYTVPGEIQHGWNRRAGVSVDLTKQGEAGLAKRCFLWNSRNLQRARELGYTNVIAVGAPFLYIPPVGPEHVEPLGDKSLILFPFHTWERESFVDQLRTYSEYLAEIRELLLEFQPVTVCLYWLQHADSAVVRLFEDEGIEVVTCGHRENNPRFLVNFQSFVARHAYVSSNHLSSAVFYALHMRKKVFLFGKSRSAEVMWFDRNRPTAVQDDSSLYPQLSWLNFDDQSHYWIGEQELGLEFKLSPGELRKLFGWNPASFTKGVSRRTLWHSLRAGRSLVRRARGR